jgi:trimethylamine:corrinoid methyltransferase-like protein
MVLQPAMFVEPSVADLRSMQRWAAVLAGRGQHPKRAQQKFIRFG